MNLFNPNNIPKRERLTFQEKRDDILKGLIVAVFGDRVDAAVNYADTYSTRKEILDGVDAAEMYANSPEM